MKRTLFLATLLLLVACSTPSNESKNDKIEVLKSTSIVTTDYELIIPQQQDDLLILFPCFPCDAENTKTEFSIVDIATENNVAVLLMNFNEHLWLSEQEKNDLEKTIVDAVTKNNINVTNTFMGGFSSGGNVSLLLTDYLKSIKSIVQPKGVFVVDSPLDILAIYESAKKTLEKNFSEQAVQEANWIIETFDTEFGTGDTAIANYTKHSPYLSKYNSIQNLSHLKGVNIRLYSEPDTLWWKENRQAAYEDMNACFIEQLSFDLKKRYGESKISYITTKGRGYRSNGYRHPHSWAIVDESDLITWMHREK